MFTVSYIGSKSFCQVEEDRLINESSSESNDEPDYCDHQESTADKNAAELPDANKENTGEAAELPDANKENTGEAAELADANKVNTCEKKRRRKRKKIDKGEFIIKAGKVPPRRIPLNVCILVLFICTYLLHIFQNSGFQCDEC